jgi:hypothetical protein
MNAATVIDFDVGHCYFLPCIVIARSEATKQSSSALQNWIASLSLSSGRPLRAGPVGSQ